MLQSVLDKQIYSYSDVSLVIDSVVANLSD